MADLKESTAAGLQVQRPAVNPNDVIRKQEYDADLAARPTSTTVSSSIDAIAHDPVTVSDSDSVSLTLTGQALVSDVIPGTAIKVDAGGVSVDLGTAHTQAAFGDHTHANDHVAATGSVTDTATTSVDGSQNIAVAVNLDPSGSLTSTASGVRVQDNTFAAKTHTHNAVTGSTPGFMTATDKTRLDTLWNEETQQFENTSTVNWTIGSTAKANVNVGVGLKDVGNGVEVDFSLVQTAGAIGGYTLTLTGAVLGSTANLSTYYVGADNGQTPDGTILLHDLIVPKTGTVKRAFVKTRIGTTGSGEFVTHYIRNNDTTSTIIGSTQYNTNPAEINNTAMSLAVNAGDRIALLIPSPNWSVQPQNIQWWCQLWIQ